PRTPDSVCNTGRLESAFAACHRRQPLRPDANRALRVALRSDPERPVESGAQVLDRRRVGQLDDLRLIESAPQPLEQLLGDVDWRAADRLGVLEDQLLVAV